VQEMKKSMLEFSSKFLQDFSLETPVETLWSLFHNKLLCLMDMFVPTKIKQTNFRKPWINHKIKKLSRQKQRAYNRARSTNFPHYWLHFNVLKKEMQRECRGTYNNCMSNIIHDSYTNIKKKKLFSYIKSLWKDYCGVSILQKDGLSYDHNQAKADILS